MIDLTDSPRPTHNRSGRGRSSGVRTSDRRTGNANANARAAILRSTGRSLRR